MEQEIFLNNRELFSPSTEFLSASREFDPSTNFLTKREQETWFLVISGGARAGSFDFGTGDAGGGPVPTCCNASGSQAQWMEDRRRRQLSSS
jgi:hypothetical protein